MANRDDDPNDRFSGGDDDDFLKPTAMPTPTRAAATAAIPGLNLPTSTAITIVVLIAVLVPLSVAGVYWVMRRHWARRNRQALTDAKVQSAGGSSGGGMLPLQLVVRVTDGGKMEEVSLEDEDYVGEKARREVADGTKWKKGHLKRWSWQDGGGSRRGRDKRLSW